MIGYSPEGGAPRCNCKAKWNIFWTRADPNNPGKGIVTRHWFKGCPTAKEWKAAEQTGPIKCDTECDGQILCSNHSNKMFFFLLIMENIVMYSIS